MARSPSAAAARPRRRARRALPLLGCVAGAALVVGLAGRSDAVAPEAPATQAPTQTELEAQGKVLYDTNCVSCHGVDGQGLDAPNGALRGPTLENAGEAGAYFQVSTGRMPLADPSRPPEAKEPAFDPDEIDALVAYVGTLGDGPALPDIDLSAGDLAGGGVLYRENCQACHSATGAGGALSYGRAAPSLSTVTPLQLGGAVRSGPGQMPRFGDDILEPRGPRQRRPLRQLPPGARRRRRHLAGPPGPDPRGDDGLDRRPGVLLGGRLLHGVPTQQHDPGRPHPAWRGGPEPAAAATATTGRDRDPHRGADVTDERPPGRPWTVGPPLPPTGAAWAATASRTPPRSAAEREVSRRAELAVATGFLISTALGHRPRRHLLGGGPDPAGGRVPRRRAGRHRRRASSSGPSASCPTSRSWRPATRSPPATRRSTPSARSSSRARTSSPAASCWCARPAPRSPPWAPPSCSRSARSAPAPARASRPRRIAAGVHVVTADQPAGAPLRPQRQRRAHGVPRGAPEHRRRGPGRHARRPGRRGHPADPAQRGRPPVAGREGWTQDGIIAYSKICTHVGCPVGLYEAQEHLLLCPCHQSTFDVLDGAEVLFGPAGRPLPQLPHQASTTTGYLSPAVTSPAPPGPASGTGTADGRRPHGHAAGGPLDRPSAPARPSSPAPRWARSSPTTGRS